MDNSYFCEGNKKLFPMGPDIFNNNNDNNNNNNNDNNNNDRFLSKKCILHHNSLNAFYSPFI